MSYLILRRDRSHTQQSKLGNLRMLDSQMQHRYRDSRNILMGFQGWQSKLDSFQHRNYLVDLC